MLIKNTLFVTMVDIESTQCWCGASNGEKCYHSLIGAECGLIIGLSCGKF